jgi:hypothetical protein
MIDIVEHNINGHASHRRFVLTTPALTRFGSGFGGMDDDKLRYINAVTSHSKSN